MIAHWPTAHAHIRFHDHHDNLIDHNSFLPQELHHIDPRARKTKDPKPRRARFIELADADIDNTFPVDDGSCSGPWIEVN